MLLTIGVKMLAHSWLDRLLGANVNLYMLAAVMTILGVGVLVSLVNRKPEA